MTGAEAILRGLRAMGVETIFASPSIISILCLVMVERSALCNASTTLAWRWRKAG